MTALQPLRIAPDVLTNDEPGPGIVLTAEAAAKVVALADYPALAQLLGPTCFALLAYQAAGRAARDGVEPGDLVHSLLVRRSAPLPDDVPSRMAADIAAVEREIVQVGRLLPRCVGLPRVPAGALGGLHRDTLRASRLEPLRALRIVPVAYRVDGFVRRVRAGKLPPPPKRCAQTIVVYALGLTDPVAWWRAVTYAEGRMLGLLALGETLGDAIDASLALAGFRDEPAALSALDIWLREGLFTRLLPVGSPGTHPPGNDPPFR